MKYSFLLCGLLLFGTTFGFSQTAPRTFVLNGAALAKNKLTIKANDPALTLLLKRADKILNAGKFYSVMDKTQLPPSGNKHDYMSQAPYWWPDPYKPNGLPYVKRDGERNPELNKISDTAEMDDMIDDAQTTALAYFFTGHETYAKHSADLIRTWFLDTKTAQNPNLKFSQEIPGINKGRGIGLIETRELYQVIDAAILLQTSKAWTRTDHLGLKNWFADFSKWMLESDLGKEEAKAKNNHGTHYDVQVIAYSIFCDHPETALKEIETAKRRIVSQLEKDGSQPLELERTLSWGYTNMNLLGFLTIAQLASNLNVDLWNYESDGRSIKRAVEWLAPYAAGKKKWTYQQIKPITYEKTQQIFRLASKKDSNPKYLELADSLPTDAFLTAIDKLTN